VEVVFLKMVLKPEDKMMVLVICGAPLLILTMVIFRGKLREMIVGILMVERSIALIISLGLLQEVGD